MITIQTVQGSARVEQVTFTRGDAPITCQLIGAPAGVTIDITNRIQVGSGVAVGTHDFQCRCVNCEGVGTSTVPVRVIVTSAAPVCGPEIAAPAGNVDTLIQYSQPRIAPNTLVGLHVDTQSYDYSTNPVTTQQIPVPTYPYNFLRTHDASTPEGEVVGFWAAIETSPGVYDFSKIANWAQSLPGKPILFNIYGTPTFYQKYPGEPGNYPAYPGLASPPSDANMSKITDFMAAARAHPIIGPRIFAFELWNEPTLPWDGTSRWTPAWGQTNNPQNPNPFYSGTATDFANMTQAAAAGRGGLPLYAGGFVDVSGPGNHTFAPILNATASNGLQTKAMIQGIGVHWYKYGSEQPGQYVAVMKEYKQRMAELGLSGLLLMNTEMGALTAGSGQPPSATEISRWLAFSALLGLSGVTLYKHTSANSGGLQIGDPVNSPAIRDAITLIEQRLSGQLICQGGVMNDGRAWVVLADGQITYF